MSDRSVELAKQGISGTSKYVYFIVGRGGRVLDHSQAIAVTWNGCPDNNEPDWDVYDALELAGSVAENGYVERVEGDLPGETGLAGEELALAAKG